MDLSRKSFTPTRVRNNPLIFAGRDVQRTKAQSDGTTPYPPKNKQKAMEYKGDLLIRYLWQNGTDIFHNMRVVNTDAKSYLEKTPEKCLQEAAREKKKIYLESCLQQRCHFYTLVASVDGQLGVEAAATLKGIASRLATKWQQPYPRTCKYVNSRISVTVVWATHRYIRGDQGSGASDQHATTEVGGRCWTKPLPIGALGKTQSWKKNHQELSHIYFRPEGLS